MASCKMHCCFLASAIQYQRDENPKGFTHVQALCLASDVHQLPNEAWASLHQHGYGPTSTHATYTILVFLAQQ